VAGRGNGQEFGESFDDSQNDDNKPLGHGRHAGF
jgi:hypothetical protein